jgi:phosphoribosylformimino-5-aminoimidazole carboxamide ribotide isomerase
MDLYARVNILEGKAVRLPRGQIEDAIFLDADPVERARGWVAKGADRLLIIDLDAAANGDYRNRSLIRDIIASVDVPVQVGGGVRSTLEVDRLCDAGAWRVVMGTVAIIDQVLFWDLCRDHPGKIVVSLDVRKNEELAIHGWTKNSGRFLEEALIELSSAGAAGFTITEAGRDALREPPNYKALEHVLSVVDEEVVAAGGVRDLDDLRELRKLEVDGKRLGGVVVGREVTSGRFTVEEAVALVRGATKSVGPWSREQLDEALADYRAMLAAADDGAARADQAEDFVRWLGGG